MSQTTTWSPIEGTVEEILEQTPRPLDAMRTSEIPCVIVRKAYPADHCAALMKRFYERELLYDPRRVGEGKPRRVDIGTSLGHHANDPDKFYEHSRGTHELFSTLFDDYEDPVKTLYGSLQKFLPDKQVMVAREPDGRLYGPSIFRTYHEGLGHGPHYDSVSKRSKRFNFAVSRFQHQYAGVLCFQNSEQHGDKGQGVLYRAPINPEIQAHLAERDFPEFAEREGIERVTVDLDPGDLYFFYSETIHEVPFVQGFRPRCVLASFIGLSDDDPEVYLWS